MQSFGKAVNTFVFSAILLAHSLKGELLVVPEGEDHSILCTAPAEDHYEITWGTGDGGGVGNDDPFTVGDEELTNNGMKGIRVLFTASPEVNGTILRCVVINFQNPRDSPEPLQFYIITQDTLPAPDVDYTIKGDGSIQFSWSPPFSHNITDVEPDISHYLVTIINMEDHSVLTVNTTDTQYLLQSQDCQLSHYQVEIAAVNVVGVGDNYTSPNLTLDELRVSNTATVTLARESPEITFQVDTSCTQELDFDFELIPTFSQQRLIIKVTSQLQQTLTLSSDDIQLNEHYNLTVRVDGTSSLTPRNLSTFDVQSVQIRLTNNDEYEITCYFATGSKARGCRVVLVNKESKVQENCNAPRLDRSGEAVIMLPAGDYSVLVYDDDDDFMGQQNPAFRTSVSSTTSNIQNIGCFPKTSDIDTPADTVGDGSNVLTVSIAVVFTSVFVIAFLAIVGVVAVLCTRKRKVSGHPENGDSRVNETKGFLQRPTTESNGSSRSNDSAANEGSSSLGDSRDSSPSQHSIESCTTTETEILPPPSSPALPLTTDTQSSPNLPNTTTAEAPHLHNTTTNSPQLQCNTTHHGSPNHTNTHPPTPSIGNQNLSVMPEPKSGESNSNQESSIHSTAPVASRQRNYIQVQTEALRNVQIPPDTRDSVLYSTILPHTSPTPINPHMNTDKVSQ